MRSLIYIVPFICVLDCLGQTTPNFKPYTQNSEFAKANEYAVHEFLDSTIHRFLLIANDPKSILHKTIQDEFTDARQTDRLQSYIYPKKLTKNQVTIQFLDWTDVHSLSSDDTAFGSSTLTAIIFVPLMIEEQHGNSINQLCFKTELEIDTWEKLDSKKTPKREVQFNIEKLELGLLKGEIMNK